MRRSIVAAFFAVVWTAASSQMMGSPSGPISTTRYFPLVDGARYEYVFLSGPHATASAVVHGGQTWAGMAGVTGVHMRLTCKDAAPCIMDVNDFYAMAPDGVRWYGGSTSTPGGRHSMTTLTRPEWPVKNPVVPGTMMAGGMGAQNAEQWHGAVSGTSTMMGAVAYSSTYQATGLETVTTPAGTFANCLRIHEKRGSGDERDVWYAPDVGIVRWTDGVEEAVLAKVLMPTAPVVQVAYAVEYHHAALDHYFITASPAEIGAVDRGEQPGWQRTGLGFFVVDAGDTSAATSFPVCRLYGRPEYGLNTHFYSGSADECAAVQRKWPMQWLQESANVFRMFMPDLDGTCPADTLPVYRSWNGRSDSNHRFTMDASVHRSMMSRGSMAEGMGDPAVAMCSPL